MKQRVTAILSAVAPSAAIKADGGGFMGGKDVIANVNAVSAVFVGSCQWQTSPDLTVWTNVGTAFTGGLFNTQTLVLGEFNRLNVTAFTSGTIIGALVSDI